MRHGFHSGSSAVPSPYFHIRSLDLINLTMAMGLKLFISPFREQDTGAYSLGKLLQIPLLVSTGASIEAHTPVQDLS